MTKTQKIWLGIFLAMFVVPEIVWAPVTNLIYEFMQNTNNTLPYRNNFLMNPDNITWLSVVLAIQLLGSIFSIVLLFKNKTKGLIFWSIISLLIILALVILFLFYLSITLGRHGIT
jgi:hypothetical protein